MSDNGKLTWTNEKRKLSELIPWPRNPRQVKVDQVRRLQESLEEFGQPETIAIGPGNEIYNGHQRLKSWADKFGDIDVDVRVADRVLTEKEREKLTVFLHKGAAGEWDFDILANEFEVDDLLDWGFDEHELDLDLWGVEPEPDPGAQIDRAEELRELWGVETGQLWIIPSKNNGEHRLLCGDCTNTETVEKVLSGKAAKATITDPPYNVGIKYTDETNDSKSFEDYIDWTQKWAKLAPKRRVLTVGCQRLVWWDTLLGDPQWIIAWVKRNGQGNTKLGGTNKWDAILVYEVEQDGGIDIIELNNDYSENIKEQGLHPTAKPVDLYEILVERFTEKGDLVYEPFNGSGTTVIACERTGRLARAIEIEPKYCAVSLQRFADTGLEPRLDNGDAG